eukprot:TRINITY_DN298_c0_g3_i1.p2 TRINITY_DN298_c0_g3~~TRINITY_DN298_c0_g3_i1.p2  ORF type:complete len:801 (+),score=61.36 TRINITY_DN298_c0_g3_i1:122-2524(+)
MSSASGINVLNSNGVKIYDLSLGKSLPQFIEEAKKKKLKLKQLKEFRNRVELIQDFDFPTVSNRVQVSPDGKYIVAAGIYPPSIKIFDTAELSLKCQRGIDSEVIQLKVLGDDYSKLAMLCADRNIEIHAQYGKHYKIRIPRHGRDMVYVPYTADIVAASSCNHIYRLNLELGRFLAPFESNANSVNCLAYCKQMNLLAAGTEDGTVEFWDYRARTQAVQIPLPEHQTAFSEMRNIGEITAAAFSSDGLRINIGSQTGKVLVYDIRYPLPVTSLQFQYRKPIISIKNHQDRLFIADKKILKVYNEKTYKLHSFIEPKHEINDVEVYPGSGLIFMALENSKIGTYFVPALGIAPKWCSFLENMTEELEETVNDTVYEDYKFLTKTDLEKLNAGHLIGTQMLKAHLHGYLMNYKHYEALRSVMEPEEDVKGKLGDDKLAKIKENRIILQKVMPRVNKAYAKELMLREERESKKKGNVKAILEDDRFKQMFTDKDFSINKNSEEYIRSHPNYDPGKEEDNQKEQEEEVDETILPQVQGEKVKEKPKQVPILKQHKAIKKTKREEGGKDRKRVIISRKSLKFIQLYMIHISQQQNWPIITRTHIQVQPVKLLEQCSWEIQRVSQTLFRYTLNKITFFRCCSIYVCEQILVWLRHRFLQCFLSSFFHLFPLLFINFLQLFLCSKPVIQNYLLKIPYWISFLSHFLNLVSCSIRKPWVRHGVPVVSISHHLNEYRPFSFQAPFAGKPHALPHAKHILSFNAEAGYRVQAGIQVLVGRGPFHRSTHAIKVVLTNIDYGQVPQFGHVG